MNIYCIINEMGNLQLIYGDFKKSEPAPYSLVANQQRHELLKKIDPAYYAFCQMLKVRGK